MTLRPGVLIHFIKWKLGLAPAEVWTTPLERDCLLRHARTRHRLAEVGVWHGGTSRELRAVMAADGVLCAVDPYEKGRLGFSFPRLVGTSELNRVANGQVIWVRATGTEAVRTEAVRALVPFDFVFIDDAQTYEAMRDEYAAWAPLVAPGGILALHDSRRGPDGIEQSSMRYVREVILHDSSFVVIEEVDSLTILQRGALESSRRLC